MKISPYSQLIAVAITSAVVSCSTPSPTTLRIPVSSSLAPSGSLSSQVFSAVNSYRAQHGKSGLERHSGLDQLAQQHCDFLANTCGGSGTNINHIGFENRAFRANKYFKISAIGENVVSSSNHSASRLIELLSSSKSHDRNMRSKWKYVGVATAMSPDGMVISTQVFGSAESMDSTIKADTFRQHW